jgi:hypothetical protein
METEKPQQYQSLTYIRLDKAVDYTKYWVERCGLGGPTPVESGFKRSFLVCKEDIKKMYDQPDFNGIRVYLGQEALGDSHVPIKLVLVAVDSLKQDILRPDENHEIPVFDFSTPCPDTCDDKVSPLYTGIMPGKK